MGLFEDLWDWVKGLVQQLIEWALSGFRLWVLNVVDVLIAPIKSTIDGIQKYVSNVINALTTFIEKVHADLTVYIDNAAGNLTTYIESVSSTLGENITKAVKNATEWAETRLADLRSYVDEKIRLWDPTDFLRDPLGYIGTAFNNLIEVYVYGAAEGLGEGIQAGLKGSNPGPMGPGRAFLLGARESLAAEEERVRNG